MPVPFVGLNLPWPDFPARRANISFVLVFMFQFVAAVKRDRGTHGIHEAMICSTRALGLKPHSAYVRPVFQPAPNRGVGLLQPGLGSSDEVSVGLSVRAVGQRMLLRTFQGPWLFAECLGQYVRSTGRGLGVVGQINAVEQS